MMVGARPYNLMCRGRAPWDAVGVREDLLLDQLESGEVDPDRLSPDDRPRVRH